MAVTVAFDLVGGWTSPHLLLRLMEVVDSPWEALKAGFTHRETKERVTIGMGPAVVGLAEAMLASVDPVLPTIDEPLALELPTHRAVVSVFTTQGKDPLATATTVLRAADAVVNAGAMALRCRTSGLAHGADGFQLLVGEVERAADREAKAKALIRAFVLLRLTGPSPGTVGLHALGAPDVALAGPTDPDRALAKLEAHALAAVLDPPKAGPDDRKLPGPLHNPKGLLRV